MVMSSMPRPTTVKPMTEPEEKATRRPLFRLSEAACAVRALELVAIFMPTKPASMDQMPPVRKAKGVNLESILPPEAKAMTSRTTNTTSKDLGHGGVLMLQISVGTFTNGSGELLHLFGAFGIAHDFLCLKQGKDDSQSESQEPNPEKAIQD